MQKRFLALGKWTWAGSFNEVTVERERCNGLMLALAPSLQTAAVKPNENMMSLVTEELTMMLLLLLLLLRMMMMMMMMKNMEYNPVRKWACKSTSTLEHSRRALRF